MLHAIYYGRIIYHKGKFEGKFSAQTTKALKSLGAEWRKGAFYISKAELPPEVILAVAASKARLDREVESLEKKFDEILSTGFPGINLGGSIDKTLWETEERIRKTTKDIVVVPHLTPDQVHKIADDYIRTYELPIQGWAQREVEKLRKKVRSRVLGGLRHEDLAVMLHKSWGMAKSHAKFVARQETKLMQTTFMESRWQAAGLDEYYWEAVAGTKLHPVRPRHETLNNMSKAGKKFRLSNPPRSSEDGQPARYNNPGRDYNCRCRARMVIRF